MKKLERIPEEMIHSSREVHMDKFGIQNFKSFSKFNSIRLAPITLIYGQNSAGKSSITQALRLLLQSFKSGESRFKLLLSGDDIEFGLPETFFHKGRIHAPLKFHFESPLRSEYFESEPKDISPEQKVLSEKYAKIRIVLVYKYEVISSIDQPVILDRIEYKFIASDDSITGAFSLQRDSPKNASFSLADKSSVNTLSKYLALTGSLIFSKGRFGRKSISKPDDSESKLLTSKAINDLLCSPKVKFGEESRRLSPLGRVTPLPEMSLSMLDGRDDRHFILPYAFHRLNRGIHGILQRFLHIAGLRASPKRRYEFGDRSGFVGQSGEHTATVLYRRTGSVKKINRWFKLLEMPYRLEIVPIKHHLAGELLIIKLKDLRNGAIVTPSDVGVGVSQVLPLLTQGMVDQEPNAKTKDNLLKVRCVEQPELHLHPKLQANLADFFIESVKENRNLRWILETHSEALILRLQRRVREGTLDPNLISVNYVNSTSGGSNITELRLDNSGAFIDEWPEGFFEEGFIERFGV
jgi:hypothetical protein